MAKTRRRLLGSDLVAALPESIRVGAFDIAIAKWDGAERAKVGGDFGEYSSATLEIIIAEDIASPLQAVEVFLHEVSHAIVSAYDIHMSDGEERVVSRQGIAWTQIYRDNPWLAGWITKGVSP